MIQHWLNNWSWTHVRLVQLGWCPRNQGLCDSEGVSIFAENLLANSGHYFSSRLMFWRHFGSQANISLGGLVCHLNIKPWEPCARLSTLWSRGSFGFHEENCVFRTSVSQGLLCCRTLVHCCKKGPYYRDRVLIGTFLSGVLGPYWVPNYISGSLFSVFWLHAREECQFSLHVYNNELSWSVCDE